jgi:hypothetical protein
MTKARNIASLLSTANGKIAGNNLDVSFENITDTGTEGTRVATGTTGQRGTTAGQLRFNTTTGLAEYYDGTAFKAIDIAPTISSLDVTEVDSQAGGNQTIVITGSNFGSGATVIFVGASGTDFNASTVTLDSDTQITAVAPKASFLNGQEPYGVRVTNVSGLSGILASQINVDSLPSWQTASGNLGTVDEGSSANFTVSATDADGDTVSYSETTSSLSGAGFSLNSSTGAITGTANLVSGDTTTSFTLRATANAKTTDRAFNIITADEGILASAEFYIDPSNSSSWSGSGSSLTNITNSGSKSGNTTNLSLNSASVETTSGITYIETASSDTLPTATIGNISGDIQNYTIVFFAKLAQTNGATDGGIFFYGNKNTNQAIGGVLATNEAGGINHYNYSNDSYFPAQTYNTWNMYTFRKVSGIKQFWYNTTQLSSISETNNTTSLPANSTFDYGGRNAPSAYIPYDFNLGFCGIWSTNISDSDITFLFNKFKGDYGL